MSELNLFQVLEALDTKEFGLYNILKEDETLHKEFDKLLDYMLPLWMVGAQNDAYHRYMLRSFDANANVQWYKLRNKNELRAKILAAIGVGKKIKHKLYNNSKRMSSTIEDVFRKIYPGIRKEEIVILVNKMSADDFDHLLSGAGYQAEERKDLIKDYGVYKKQYG